ncbi:hypothetical protein PAXRUDRAFT_164947 [Paxillus rubicundulus Ve08.2h10]|uniref:Uncharacterized protein n=1 Tax=Paxillus rubicundulus Ve08.2h10 TaxID=930991 RepID=A0A0D0DBS5_9AGAM|nr:hypothetical protein PAXRUDRAFT_164947 [Paxillus rubicundulus Ve08.2h10]
MTPGSPVDVSVSALPVSTTLANHAKIPSCSDIGLSTSAPGGSATTLLHLQVTTVNVGGELRFQQTYHGFSFDVPRAGALGPFYLVTRGQRVGVFATWYRTSPHVLGISCSSFTRVQSLDSALLHMLDAIDLGEAQWLP